MTMRGFTLFFDDLSGQWMFARRIENANPKDSYDTREEAIRACDLRNAYDVIPEIPE